ncbi:hypothetical protein B0I35DRAFT_483377 [Stachybotrys elegans]|uniref:Uncharacterized protein n=1 Tax=Stachybotrys elegans TaxID=80388 RepID=A0A8K0SHA2_9HYPO|nr:hypothetical protein B0I35DRAFT_483377 [Stachybotrys elegans]
MLIPKLLSSFLWPAWGQQYCALAAAISTFVGIVMLLSEYDGKVIFEWNGITLNALISILSVATKAALAFIISECMAQWKWILFTGDKRLLIDFDRMDAAARGPLGSIRVLLKSRGALIAQFGAILTIINIALDPFAQQLIQLRQETVSEPGTLEADALISSTHVYALGEVHILGHSHTNGRYEDGETIDTVEEWWNITTSIPPSMEGAVLNGFYKSLAELERETLFQCSAGNCTFDPFTTLGICHRCSDVTSHLAMTEEEDFAAVLVEFGGYQDPIEESHATAFRLPNGHFIANHDSTKLYHTGYFWPSYIATSFGTGNPNKTVYNVSRPSDEAEDPEASWPNVSMKASECALYYCIQNITSRVDNFRLHEEVSELVGVTRSPDSWDSGLDGNDDLPPEYHAPPDEARALEFHELWSVADYESLELDVPMSSESYRIEADSIKSLSAHMQGLFTWKEWDKNTNINKPTPQDPGHGRSSIFRAVAASMTNEMRRTSAERDLADNGMRTMSTRGNVTLPSVLYEVQWSWLSLHFSMLVSVSLFLGLTIWRSSGEPMVPLWKSSSLATIRHGREIGGLLDSDDTTVGLMEYKARKLYFDGHQVDGEAKPCIGSAT